ncbi:unnamed protein product [Rotaria sp. Silwood2]|nr:unnamed protein product [Rotaria sp. Silwood2]
MTVQYVDAWFVTSTCIFSCGLTTMDFAKLSRATQIILMGFTFVSGITISTLPALVIKTQTHKSPQGTTVDDDHDETHDENNEELPISNFREQRNLPEHVRAQLASLPTPAKLRYRAYIMCILLILGTRFTIYTSAYFAIGGRIHRRYKPEDLLQGNTSVNPCFFILTRTWLFVFIFLICAIEYRRMAPVDPNITLLKIIFEIISAFGTVGLTLGYPNVASSFGTVLSPASKVILGITMLMGRHRGLLASMKDQEVIEYSAVNVLARRREELILQFDRSREARESIVQGLDSSSDIVIERF